MDYDVAVVGGGPGGYVAAIRAAQLGASVLLVEKAKLGGVCLNRGCIPTKTLLASAEKWRELQRCSEFGLTADKIGFDFRLVRSRMQQVVVQMRKGIEQLMKSNAIEVLAGTASLLAPDRLCIQTEQGEKIHTARKIIVATGSSPVGLPVPGGDLPQVINSDQLLALDEVPKRLVVIGAGAVGVEFAAIFQAFGCEVTVVEMLPVILPNIDGELSKRMALLLRKQGIKLLANTRVTGVEAADSGVVVTVADEAGSRAIEADKVLVAIGRRPVVEDLGLEAAGVAYTCKGILINEKMETNVAGVYAIGDVTGGYMWAHAASAAGLAAAENACGRESAVDFRAVPGCIYTTPEVATVGLTEQEALAQGKTCKVSKFPFAANGKAVSMGETDGLVKIVAEAQTGQVLGMHILGAHASDLIMEGVLAIQNGLPAHAIAGTIHPHPSLAETIMECAHGVDGPMLHQVRSRL